MKQPDPDSGTSRVPNLPEFSATTLIDLKGLVGTIHEAKGATDESGMDGNTGENLLDVFAAEAEKLRTSKAKPGLIMPILLQKLGCGLESELGRAALKASEMAGAGGEQPTYHNDQHVTEVILAAYCLGMREHLPVDRVVELLIAAAAHDLGHTGGINQHAYELETRSYHIIYPVLVEAGLGEERIERIGRMIVSTDFANGVPLVRVAYRECRQLPPDHEERLLAAQCVILTEADILFSCFNENYNEMLSGLLSVEWNRKEMLSVPERVGFLSSVEFVSDAAIQLGLEQRRKTLWYNLTRRTGRISYPHLTPDAEARGENP